jgi:hypothetical protein
MNTDTWHHIAATYDGSNKILYLNGSIDGTGSGSLSTTSGNGEVGRQADFNNNFFDGVVDDVRIYDSALSASEVSALASSSSASEPAETFAFLGLLTTAGLGFREWRDRRKAKAA